MNGPPSPAGRERDGKAYTSAPRFSQHFKAGPAWPTLSMRAGLPGLERLVYTLNSRSITSSIESSLSNLPFGTVRN
jgi:hypothetical protein